MGGNCIKCGGSLGDFDAGGDMICDSCEARGSGSSGGNDVPCQRCGMYLPSHELQMWNARLYCAYCIMDVKDEEKRRQAYSSEVPLGRANEAKIRKHGTCQRCGKETDTLYTLSGMNLCADCYFPEGTPHSGDNRPSRFGQIVTYMKQKLGIIIRAKAVPSDPRPEEKNGETFDIRGRRMMEKGGDAADYGGSSPCEEGGRGKQGKREKGGDEAGKCKDKNEGQPRGSFYSFKGKTDPKK